MCIFAVCSTVSVVRATWEKDAGFLEFYSDVTDASIPTVSLGVPNTERGELNTERTWNHHNSEQKGQYKLWLINKLPKTVGRLSVTPLS